MKKLLIAVLLIALGTVAVAQTIVRLTLTMSAGSGSVTVTDRETFGPNTVELTGGVFRFDTNTTATTDVFIVSGSVTQRIGQAIGDGTPFAGIVLDSVAYVRPGNTIQAECSDTNRSATGWIWIE